MARIAQTDEYLRIPFMQRKTLEEREIPVFEMPELNMDPDAAQRIVKDELYLDGNPTLVDKNFLKSSKNKNITKN